MVVIAAPVPSKELLLSFPAWQRLPNMTFVIKVKRCRLISPMLIRHASLIYYGVRNCHPYHSFRFSPARGFANLGRSVFPPWSVPHKSWCPSKYRESIFEVDAKFSSLFWKHHFQELTIATCATANTVRRIVLSSLKCCTCSVIVKDRIRRVISYLVSSSNSHRFS